jgi:hypothetical protein
MVAKHQVGVQLRDAQDVLGPQLTFTRLLAGQPDFSRCTLPALPAHVSTGPGKRGRRVRGLDFGFRNQFATIWRTVDRDGILWLTGEHYARHQPLSNTRSTSRAK